MKKIRQAVHEANEIFKYQ